MRWDVALDAITARVKADAQLCTALGGPRIRETADGKPEFPSVTHMIVSGPLRENTERIVMQWDLWARAEETARTIERRLRALLHSDLPEMVGAVPMWLQLIDRRDHEDPEPGTVHRSLDFAFEFAKEA